MVAIPWYTTKQSPIPWSPVDVYSLSINPLRSWSGHWYGWIIDKWVCLKWFVWNVVKPIRDWYRCIIPNFTRLVPKMLMVYRCLSSCSLLKSPMFTAMLPGYRLCCYSLPPATVPRRCSWSFVTNLAWSHALPRAAAGEPWLHFFVTSRRDLTGVLREESPNGFISG